MIDPDDPFAAARRDTAPLPRHAVHARVLHVPLTASATPGSKPDAGVGTFAWNLVVWDDPGGAPALHAALRPLVEAALLTELSAPFDTPDDERPAALRLLSFADVDRFEDAVRAFGLREVPHDDAFEEALRHARGEANRVGREPPEQITRRFEAKLASPDVLALEDALRKKLGDEVFGARPGALFAALNQVLAERGETPLPPKRSSLDALETRLGVDVPDVLRWIPPRLFQALCDAVAVVATTELKREVQWAASEVEDDGLARPPLVRVRVGEWLHLPIGLHLLRWCVMPRGAGEQVPSIAEWLTDELGPKAS